MTAYIWRQLTADQRIEAMSSAMSHPLMSVQVAARGVQLAATPAEQDRAAIWLDMGDGRWEARAALWPRDLEAGVRVSEVRL